MSNEFIFDAHWERTIWLLSSIFVGSILLETAILTVFGIVALRYHNIVGRILLVSSLVGPIIILLGILLSPTRYTLNLQSISINRLGSDIIFPLEDIKSITLSQNSDFIKRSTRIVASGGAFGYYGIFSHPQVGRFKAYVTNRKNIVIIKLYDGKIIAISPDKPNEFFEAVSYVRKKLSDY